MGEGVSKTFRHKALLCSWHDKAVADSGTVRERGVICTLPMSIEPIKALARFDWQTSLGSEAGPSHTATCRALKGDCRPTNRHFLFIETARGAVWYRILGVQDSLCGRYLTLTLAEQERDAPGHDVPEPARKYGGH